MKAMLSPVVGHLDPDFIKVMDDIKKMLRIVFRTANEITFPVSGTGSAGMETVLANLIEEGDEVVIGVAGVFGTRLAELATRLGARVNRVDAEWGRIVEPERIVFTYAFEDFAERQTSGRWSNESGNPGHETIVTVNFEDLGAKTRLTVHQAVFESQTVRDEHLRGWGEALDRLAEYVAKA